jgi:hypothetical protein
MSELEGKRRQLEMAERTLKVLEERAAGYTVLTIPASLQTELEEKREEVAALKEEVERLEDSAPAPPVPSPPSQLDPIPFQNREDESKQILSSFAPPYFLLDAPAGYGKSVLLQRLAERFYEDSWLFAHVRLGEDSNLDHLVAMLAQQLEVDFSPKGSNVRRWGADLAGAIKRSRFEEVTRSGLVFLIDFDKKPARDVLKGLLDQFIPAVQESLRVLDFFSSRHNRFRVTLAGRYLAGRTEVASCAIPLSVRRLTPFDFNTVRATVRAIFAQHEDVAVTQIAAHLMHLTGGHPGCLDCSLRKYKEVGYTPDDFLEFCSEEIWTKVVRPVVQNVHDNIQRDLHRVLDRLSVFRYLDYPLLDRLTGGEEPTIEGYARGHELADKLTGTYLLSWQGRLLRDDITRRLLTIRLREEEENFPEWCRQAQEMCADHLQRSETQSPEVWAIEYLYQILQEHAGTVQDPEQRAAIRERLLTSEVPSALQWLVERRQKRMEQLALSKALEKDWEFRFTVNYFLREEEYSDRPYQRLHRQIEEFFSAQLLKEEQTI